ncbi:hypothetical protein OS188_12630 [Xanthomarina sp. F1114]|uniref:hypothetical protein n=1 Tax=Xanthomarina sp. F1114 TaxID=2996019 RepID=UPI00225E6213|nr:hypothetical protein [Xanthomarina sp. F1114]MCX7548799.1 hypothetical protein [Xanthomarina sp. F1114]
MKKLIFTLSLVLVSMSSSLFAQSNTEEIDMVQSIFGMEKKALVAEVIQPETAKSDAFWALYDEYEVKRKDLGKRRIVLLNSYADSYDTLDEATIDKILKEMMSLQVTTDKLIGNYAKKIKKSVDVKTAAQFYQIEGYLLSKIRTTILENIPVIGELDK